jgi:hypothetical protein
VKGIDRRIITPHREITFLLRFSWMSDNVREVSIMGGVPGRIVKRCLVVLRRCWTLGMTRGMKSVMSLSSGRKTDTERCSHHREVLKESSLGGVSPTIAESCTKG